MPGIEVTIFQLCPIYHWTTVKNLLGQNSINITNSMNFQKFLTDLYYGRSLMVNSVNLGDFERISILMIGRTVKIGVRKHLVY